MVPAAEPNRLSDLDRSGLRNNTPCQTFTSTSRWRIFLRACLATGALVVWFVLMDFLGLAGGFVGAVGIFLMVATAALFIFALRSQHRVSLDETGFLLGRGQKEKKETFIPWYELAKDEKTLKKENLMG